MRAPKKVIAAMAMATLIGGTVLPAFADGDFKASTGENNGQGMQKAIKPVTGVADTDKATGDIKITGTFSKTVTTLPDIKNDGKYLRVTMPLMLNYSYDLSNDVMNSVPGMITNASVEAKEKSNEPGKFDLTHKGVEMSFVGIEKKDNNVEYVETIKSGDQQKAQLPFKLVVKKGNGEPLAEIPLANLIKDDSNGTVGKVQPITIEAKNNITFKIEQIDGQPVQNKELLKDGQTVSSALTLKFAYQE